MRALEKGVATHSSVLAWRVPGTEEPSGLPSRGRQSWTRLSDSAAAAEHMYLYIVTSFGKLNNRADPSCIMQRVFYDSLLGALRSPL